MYIKFKSIISTVVIITTVLCSLTTAHSQVQIGEDILYHNVIEKYQNDDRIHFLYEGKKVSFIDLNFIRTFTFESQKWIEHSRLNTGIIQQLDFDKEGNTLAFSTIRNDSLEISVFDNINNLWIKRPSLKEFKYKIVANSSSWGQNVKLSSDGKFMVTLVPNGTHNIATMYRYTSNTWQKENELIIENLTTPNILINGDNTIIVFSDQYSPRSTIVKKVNNVLQIHVLDVINLKLPFGNIFKKLSHDGKNLYIIAGENNLTYHEFINIDIIGVPQVIERHRFDSKFFYSADISSNGKCFVVGDFYSLEEIDKVSYYTVNSNGVENRFTLLSDRIDFDFGVSPKLNSDCSRLIFGAKYNDFPFPSGLLSYLKVYDISETSNALEHYDNYKSSTLIHPNPTTGLISVKEEWEIVSVSDLMGHTINTSNISFDLSDLQSGIYIITLKHNSICAKVKLVKI